MIRKLYLVIDGEGEARLVKRVSYIKPGEVGFELRINIPDEWGGVVGAIDIAIPSPPTVTADGPAIEVS